MVVVEEIARERRSAWQNNVYWVGAIISPLPGFLALAGGFSLRTAALLLLTSFFVCASLGIWGVWRLHGRGVRIAGSLLIAYGVLVGLWALTLCGSAGFGERPCI